jgi:tetratricopeptide (TPR) repeat protein
MNQPSNMGPAEAEARRAVAARPDDADAWHSLAFALIAAGKMAAARDCLERAVALDGASVMTRNNLGIVLHRLGEADLACAAYGAALELDPDNAVAHANLACVLGELGQFEASLRHAERAAALTPGELAPCIYAAVALANLDRREAALAWLDRALALAPQNLAVMIDRAELLRVLGRAEDGLADALTAVELEPYNPNAQNVLGLICQALGRDEQALAAFDRAAAMAPRPARVHANKAIVLLELGRRPEALASLDLALAAEPDLASAWYVRSDLKAFGPDDPDIAAMEAILGRGAAPTHDRILMRFALGKAYLDAGDGPRAFAHLGEGGRLKRAGIAHDPQAAADEMARLAEIFTPALFERFAGPGAPSAAPIFIVGMPRSGGTLIEQVLASHPKVQAGGEPRHVDDLVADLGGAYPEAVATFGRDQFAALGRAYLDRALGASGAGRVTDKAANLYLRVGLIHLMLPNARIIHCRRDPVDTCLSCYSKLFTAGQAFTYDLAELGDYYRRYAGLMDHWRAALSPETFIEVEYEAVVDDLEGQARRLIAHCGLDWDPNCLRFHETERAVRTASLNQVRQPIYRSSVGRWKRFRDELTPLRTALGDRDLD